MTTFEIVFYCLCIYEIVGVGFGLLMDIFSRTSTRLNDLVLYMATGVFLPVITGVIALIDMFKWLRNKVDWDKILIKRDND